jgi:hypothetical protein
MYGRRSSWEAFLYAFDLIDWPCTARREALAGLLRKAGDGIVLSCCPTLWTVRTAVGAVGAASGEPVVGMPVGPISAGGNSA